MRCKQCKLEMKECGFERYNFRYECGNCNLIFVPFMERHFGESFLGVKWEKKE